MDGKDWNLGGREASVDQRAEHLAKVDREFDAWAEAGRGERMERGHWATASQALDRVPLNDGPDTLFLDLGCGNGYTLRAIAPRLHADALALGLDLSLEMVRRVQALAPAWRADLDGPAAGTAVIQASFDAIPLPDGCVHHGYSHEALYYAPDVDAALAEVVRVLRPGGTFHTAIDHYQENRYSHDWSDRVGLPMLLESQEGWEARLAQAGLTDVASERLFEPPETVNLEKEPEETRELLRDWKLKQGTLLLSGRKPST